MNENPADFIVPVVAGIIRDDRGRVLLSRRRSGTHLENLWEFPGGKLEDGEKPSDGLARELEEELGIRVSAARPLLSVTHEYPEKTIRLWLWEVEAYEGDARGLEGQPLRWIEPEHLPLVGMPPADRPVTRMLGLASQYAISPDPFDYPSDAEFIRAWRACLESGLRLLRLRPRPTRGRDRRLRELAAECAAAAREYGARWLWTGEPSEARQLGADGIHLSARQLAGLRHRPLPDALLVAASCHDLDELRQAAAVGADFVTLSPVLPTTSHPGAPALGWPGLAELVARSPLPVFALGGLGPADLGRARDAGAFGVAGISAFGWNTAQ